MRPAIGGVHQTALRHPRIALIGLQPAMVASLAPHFPLRVTDMDPANIGQIKEGIRIEDPSKTPKAVEESDVVLVTGTTAVNSTIEAFLKLNKPVIFYGVTISGIARLMGLEQFCACGH